MGPRLLRFSGGMAAEMKHWEFPRNPRFVIEYAMAYHLLQSTSQNYHPYSTQLPQDCHLFPLTFQSLQCIFNTTSFLLLTLQDSANLRPNSPPSSPSWNSSSKTHISRGQIGETKKATTATCVWTGVNCNKNGDVININWGGGAKNFLGEQPKLQWLPSTVQSIFIFDSGQKGSLDAAKLPKDLCGAAFSGNNYEGSFDFSNLPPGLSSLGLNDNQFTGGVNLKCLPEPTSRKCLLVKHE